MMMKMKVMKLTLPLLLLRLLSLQLRYFPAASAYNDVARSNLITVEDRDMVIATPSRVVQGSDEQLIATWQIYSVPTSKWDWYLSLSFLFNILLMFSSPSPPSPPSSSSSSS